MKILVIGGTRFFGIPMVKELIEKGHDVTIATRGRAKDCYGDTVSRVIIERTNPESIRNAFTGRHFDVVIDKIAYCSNDVRYLLDNIDCDKYIEMSTTAVYEPKHMNTIEEDFNGINRHLVWCDRPDFSYDEVKRNAECALWQAYRDRKWIAVRYPFVAGRDDYTNRIKFYVEHVKQGIPMYIDNLFCQMGYIRSDEAGKFIAFLCDKDFEGPVNGCSQGTISIREMLDYVETRTGKMAILSPEGDAAPYNGEPEYSINTEKAKGLGFTFSTIKDWIFDLLDYYIEWGD